MWRATDPDGQPVVLTFERWRHIVDRHRELTRQRPRSCAPSNGPRSDCRVPSPARVVVVEPVTPSPEASFSAGELRARAYDRRAQRISLADCFVLVTAENGETVLTTDGTLATVARDEGIDVVLLGA